MFTQFLHGIKRLAFRSVSNHKWYFFLWHTRTSWKMFVHFRLWNSIIFGKAFAYLTKLRLILYERSASTWKDRGRLQPSVQQEKSVLQGRNRTVQAKKDRKIYIINTYLSNISVANVILIMIHLISQILFWSITFWQHNYIFRSVWSNFFVTFPLLKRRREVEPNTSYKSS